ncbi:MAG TPA: SLBB domain-containing protein [Phycisphaerae bacterium]|nr:SLBB domain-containing protein [Phycisphaerae bacterium]HRY70645.1 SLBB domain-containing protein [Phycisphaerae bacterium]HSA28960.1 SLBB domain-containing protein [Phycisphaerae bacterium]
MRRKTTQMRVGFILGLLCTALAVGCGEASTPEEVTRFQQAGPVQPPVDEDRVVDAKLPSGPYRPVAGDVLEMVMPAVLQEARSSYQPTIELTRPESHLCRVGDDGRITLPIIGELDVRGRSLPEIEALATKAYYPKYVKERPSIVAKVQTYRTARVSIVGAINLPGVYELQSQEMSLVALLMKAGGIDLKGSTGAAMGGASVVRIKRMGDPVLAVSAIPQTQPAGSSVRAPDSPSPSGQAGSPPGQAGSPPGQAGVMTVVLPVRGLNIPFADVPLVEGDMVEIEGLKPEVFTVIGLVNKAGAFPYPPGTQFSLLQALSFAAGLNDIADPQYAKIYRQDADGSIVEASFKVKGSALTSASNVMIKPGDVIAVEHTPATRFNLVLAEVFKINAGVNLQATYYYWNPYDYDTGRTSLRQSLLQDVINNRPTLLNLGQ